MGAPYIINVKNTGKKPMGFSLFGSVNRSKPNFSNPKEIQITYGYSFGSYVQLLSQVISRPIWVKHIFCTKRMVLDVLTKDVTGGSKGSGRIVYPFPNAYDYTDSSPIKIGPLTTISSGNGCELLPNESISIEILPMPDDYVGLEKRGIIEGKIRGNKFVEVTRPYILVVTNPTKKEVDVNLNPLHVTDKVPYNVEYGHHGTTYEEFCCYMESQFMRIHQISAQFEPEKKNGKFELLHGLSNSDGSTQETPIRIRLKDGAGSVQTSIPFGGTNWSLSFKLGAQQKIILKLYPKFIEKLKTTIKTEKPRKQKIQKK